MSKFLTETQDPGVRGGTPVNAVQAEKTIDPAGTNNKIKWKARAYGRRGNRVSVEYRHDVSPVASHLIKAGADNTLRFDARVPGDAGDAITVATLDPAAPNAVLGVREYAGNLNVDLATGAGDKAAASLAAGAGSVEVEADAPGPGGNGYTADVVTQAVEDAALAVELIGSVLTVKQGMDKGDQAVAVMQDYLGTGIVDVTVVAPGAAGNAYTAEVAEGVAEDGALSASLYAGSLKVVLGMDKGDPASAEIGAGSVHIEAEEVLGSAGNAYTVEVKEGIAGGDLVVDNPVVFPLVNDPDLVGWYDASQLVLNDDDPVSSWTDESGAGNHATKTGANRPTYKTGRQGGLPAVNFDGADDFLTLPTGVGTGDVTVFAVFDRDPMDNHQTLLSFGDAATKNFQIRIKLDDGHLYFGAGDGGEAGTEQDMGAIDTAAHMIAARHDKGVDLVFRTDGVEVFNGAFTPTISANGNEGQFGVRVGDAGWWKGDISEIIIFARALSPSEIVQVETYLSQKYFTGLVTNFVVTLGMDNGDPAVAYIGDGAIRLEVVEPGTYGNTYSVQIVSSPDEDEPVDVQLNGPYPDPNENQLIMTLGYDKGEKKFLDLGAGSIRLEALLPGGEVDNDQYTAEVVEGGQDASLSAEYYAGHLKVTLGMTSGDKANVLLNTTSPAGEILVEVDQGGAAGNGYSIQVIQGAADAVLSVWLYANMLTIELPADPYGTPIHAHADDVIDAINAAEGATFTASLQSGQMSSEVDVQSDSFVNGADNWTPDPAKNTVALVAAAIVGAGTMYDFSTTVTPYGNDPLTAADVMPYGPVPLWFPGGSNSPQPDPAKNTAALIAAAINTHPTNYPQRVIATVTGYGNDPLTAADFMSYPHPFVGGGENFAPDPAKNTAALVAAELDGFSDFIATATPYGNDPLTAADVTVYPIPFTGGGENLAPDPAKNTASLVAAAINAAALYVLEADARAYYDALPFSTEDTYPFTGGGENLAADPAKNTASLVAAAINASEGATFTATAVYDDPIEDPPYVVPFAGGGANAPITSTGAQVAAIVDAQSALVTCDVIAGNGALPVTPFAAENLHGGSDFGEGEAMEVETTGNRIVVHLATDPYEGEIVTTAADILAEIGPYHPLVTVEADEAYSDGLVTAVVETHLAGGTPSGPVSITGTILEDSQYRYTAFEDALERDDEDFEGHWDRIAL